MSELIDVARRFARALEVDCRHAQVTGGLDVAELLRHEHGIAKASAWAKPIDRDLEDSSRRWRERSQNPST